MLLMVVNKELNKGWWCFFNDNLRWIYKGIYTLGVIKIHLIG